MVLGGHATEEALLPDLGQVCCESVALFLDLMSQFPRVAEDEHRDWLWVVIELMKNGQDEDSSLASTGDSLANHILAHNCIRYTLLLNRRWLLKSALIDGPIQLVLQQKVFEPSTVHSSIVGYPNLRIKCLMKGSFKDDLIVLIPKMPCIQVWLILALTSSHR
jgi:hypothetical protein